MAAVILAHEPDADRYTLRVGDELVSALEYREQGGVASFTRTFTQPHRRGQGHAEQLTAFAVDDAEQRGLQVLPLCWYVAEWFDRHPERASVLAGQSAG